MLLVSVWWRLLAAGAALAALWVAVLYAATDEFHQTFVPTREGCLRDVFIDSTGAIAAGQSFAPMAAPRRIAAAVKRLWRNAASASTASAVGQ